MTSHGLLVNGYDKGTKPERLRIRKRIIIGEITLLTPPSTDFSMLAVMIEITTLLRPVVIGKIRRIGNIHINPLP